MSSIQKSLIYPIEKSPLFRLKSKRKLEDLLFSKQKGLQQLCQKSNYQTYPQKVKNKKRIIHNPQPVLKKLMKRLNVLLSRIEKPEYLFSKKKSCYVNNAAYHISAKYAATLDLQSFFPSTRREMLFYCFVDTFQMSRDVAHLMCDLVCYKDHMPIGSPTSQALAFYAYKKTFDRIYNVAQQKKIRFSLFVDDMSFSSDHPIPPPFLKYVETRLNKVYLSLKKEKTRDFSRMDDKWITGCKITARNSLKANPAFKEKIYRGWQDISKFRQNPNGDCLKDNKYRDLVKSTLGLIRAVQQVEPELFVAYEKNLRKEVAIIHNFERKSIIDMWGAGTKISKISQEIGVSLRLIKHVLGPDPKKTSKVPA